MVLARAYSHPVDPLIDGRNREEMCRFYQRRLVAMARKVHARVPEGDTSVEDLVGFGVIGLLEAFDRYSPVVGVGFEAFAEYRIRGAMLDALRTADTSTRRRRLAAKRIADATQKGQDSLGRTPGHTEIAGILNVDMDEYWRLRNMACPITLFPLEASFDSPDESTSALRRIAAQEARVKLRKAIEALPERERQVAILYHGRGLSLAEVGQVFGVSASRICQILSAVCGKLRVTLRDSIDGEGLSDES